MTRLKVLMLIEQGYSRKEISDALGINIRVVDFHCRNLMKLGLIKRKPPVQVCIYEVTALGRRSIVESAEGD